MGKKNFAYYHKDGTIWAKEKGIGPTTLVRMWIRDQLSSFRRHA